MDSSNDFKTCPACNSNYETIYYQRRAADEPPDKVSYCINCPVDTTKLKIENSFTEQDNRNDNDTRFPNHTRNETSTDGYRRYKNSLTNLYTLKNRGYRLCIQIQGMAASRCYKQVQQKNIVFEPVIVSTISIQIGNAKKLVQVYRNSVLKGEGHVTIKSSRIGPLVSLDQLTIYSQKEDTINDYEGLVVGYETQINSIQGADFTILRTLHDGRQPSLLVFLPISSSIENSIQSTCLSILQEMLTRYGTERTIKSFVSSQMISTLYVQSSKAYDWPSAPDEGYVYTWKPDGERFWYLRYGSVWLFSRRLLSGRITGWNISTSLIQADKVGPVFDVEVLIRHPPILMDLLISDSGKPTPPLRSLDLVLEMFRRTKDIDTPIFVRDYYKSQQDLLKTKSRIDYPIDGVVGIQDNSMNIIKLKDTKSIELKLKGNGDLVSAEDKLVIQSELHNTYPIDSVVEVRFTKQSSADAFSITETLLRTDKTKANAYEVCEDIINTISSMPDTLARRNAVQWCSSVRQKINQVASKPTGKGRVIMDIGAGDGQAISDYTTDPNITYILIEPDINKCQKLMRRLMEPGKGKSRLFEGPEHITRVVGLVSNRTLKYAVICSTIGNILKEQHCIRTLKACLRYSIASFSISHTVYDLQQLALGGIDIIGCGYMYDSVDKMGKLVNESGVVMQLIDTNTASVKWGGDKAYQERAIRLGDFNNVFHIRLATSLVPVFNSSESSLLNTVSAKVYIISTKKHI